MAQSTKPRTKKKTRKKTSKFKSSLTPVAIVLGILVALMASLFLLCLLFFSQKEKAPADTAPENQEISFATAAPSLPYSELAAECFGMENGYKTYQSDTLTASLGIDVSSHQGWIDWQAVADSDVDYAMLRCGYRGYSEGETNQDEYFSYNLESATTVGLDVGIYYFSQALTEAEAVAEAEEVLSMIEGYSLAYPIYFDWETVEDASARTSTISSSELTACALAFCRTIENAGYKAGVYFNLSTAMRLYKLYELRDYDFWLAEYQETPSYPFAIDMWQYTDAGQVPGISTNVDLNLSFH